MALYREDGNIIIVCNKCDAVEFDAATTSWKDAFSALLEDGWSATKIKNANGGPDWWHKCPECRSK